MVITSLLCLLIVVITDNSFILLGINYIRLPLAYLAKNI
jgi:hypothetical protein